MKKILLTLLMMITFIPLSEAKKINVLIIDGFSNHFWEQTTKEVIEILSTTNLFNIEVSTCPATINTLEWKTWNPNFNKYDVVIQNTNNVYDTTIQWPPAVMKNLESYVNKGGGLYILHSANNAFPNWHEYNMMIGMGWRKKDQGQSIEISKNKEIIIHEINEGEDTYHGERLDVNIEKLNSLPINSDFPERWMTPNLEIYKYCRGECKNLTVLSYSQDPNTERNWPVEWIVNYGKGTVYNSSMGHLWKDEEYPASFRCIGFQTTMIRVTEWLGSSKVTYPLPDIFPSENKLELTKIAVH